MNKKLVYMDNAATTITKQEVVNGMLQYFTILYGNPSSIYEFAGKSKNAIETARKSIAHSIGANSEEIYFTSGGTESDNWALRSIAKSYKKKGKHIITTKIEHPAVLNTAKNLEDLGYDITYVNVDENGIIKTNDLVQSIREDTILISVMMANNEIGTIQPIKEIGKIAKDKNIIFHTDAVQAYGQIPIDVDDLNIDLMSVSAHKFHGPKGIGFLYIRNSTNTCPLIFGGGQENNKRSGTQNVPCIVGMSLASDIAHKNMKENLEKETKLRDYMINRVLTEIPFTRLNGEQQKRLPNNANFSFQFAEASEILAMLDIKGICASSGSACSSRSDMPSHVLAAIGLPNDISFASIRLTISDETTIEEIDYVIDSLKEIICELRKDCSQYTDYFAK